MSSPEPSVRPCAALLVAAGLSTRMQAGAAGPRKAFLVLEGRTVLEHAAEACARAAGVRDLVVVGHPDDLDRIRRLSASSPALAKVRAVVAGGELRTDSVRAGLAAVSGDVVVVAVHDVARPLVRTETIERALAVAAREGASLVAVPVADTIKTSVDGERVERTLDRSVLWSAQTPQCFRVELLRALLERAGSEGFRPTDDAALHERYVGPVPIVRGESTNLKLTTVDDLALAAAILRAREAGRRP